MEYPSFNSSSALTKGKYEYEQFQKTLSEEDPFAFEHKKDGGMYVNGKLVYLNKKLQVVVGEKQGSRWQRLIHKVLQQIGKRSGDLSFEDYHHQSLCKESVKLQARLSSKFDVTMPYAGAAQYLTFVKKGAIPHKLPPSMISEYQQGKQLVVTTASGRHFKVFSDGAGMHSHLESLLFKLTDKLPVPETPKDLNAKLKNNWLQGLKLFFKEKCSWAEMLRTVQIQNEMLLEQTLSTDPINFALEKTLVTIPVLNQWSIVAASMLSVISDRAKQICFVRTDEQQKLLLMTPAHLELLGDSLKFQTTTENNASVYKEGATAPKQFAGPAEEAATADGSTLLSSQPREESSSLITSAAYQQPGADRLSLDGFLCQGDTVFSSQFDVTRDGNPVQVFTNQKDMEGYVEAVHDQRLSNPGAEIKKQLNMVADKAETMNEETLNATSVPNFNNYLTRYYGAPNQFERAKADFICDLREHDVYQNPAAKEKKRRQLLTASSATNKSSRPPGVEGNFLLRDNGVLEEQIDKALDPKHLTLESTRKSLSKNIAYVDTQRKLKTEEVYVMLSPGDNIVLLSPLDHDETVQVTTKPMQFNPDKNETDYTTNPGHALISKQNNNSCTLSEAYHADTQQIFRKTGKNTSAVTVFSSEINAEESIAQQKLDLDRQMLKLEKQLDQMSTQLQLDSKGRERKQELQQKVQTLERQQESVERNVAWLATDGKTLMFIRNKLTQGEVVVEKKDPEEAETSAATPNTNIAAYEMDFGSRFNHDEKVEFFEKSLKEQKTGSLFKFNENKQHSPSSGLFNFVNEDQSQDDEQLEMRDHETLKEKADAHKSNAAQPVKTKPDGLGETELQPATTWDQNKATPSRAANKPSKTTAKAEAKDIFSTIQWATVDTDKPDSPAAETQYRARIHYLKQSFSPRIGPIDLRKHPLTYRLLREIKQDEVTIGMKTLEHLLAAINWQENTFIKKDNDTLRVPAGAFLQAVGVRADKAKNLGTFAGEVYFELLLAESGGVQPYQKKLLQKIMKQIPGCEHFKPVAQLLLKAEKQTGLESLSPAQIVPASMQTVKKLLVQQYAQGVVSQEELFYANFTEQEILGLLGVDPKIPADPQFQILAQQGATGKLTEKVFAQLCHSIPGGRQLYHQLKIISILEPGSIKNLPLDMRWDDPELPKNIVSGTLLKQRMEKYFGKPLPKNRSGAFNRFYTSSRQRKVYGEESCFRVLCELGGEDKVKKLNRLEDIYTKKVVSGFVKKGLFDQPGKLDNVLIQECGDGKISVLELLKFNFGIPEIVEHLSAPQLIALVAQKQLNEGMLQEAGLTSDTLRESGKRTELLQKYARKENFQGWETARLLSDNFVKQQLLHLCALKVTPPSELIVTGISYNDILAVLSEDDRVLLCLQGFVPKKLVQKELAHVDLNEMFNFEDGVSDQEKFDKLLSLHTRESSFPDFEKMTIPQNTSMFLNNVPRLVMQHYSVVEGNTTLGNEDLLNTAKSLYAAGALPKEAMHIMGFFDADLIEIKKATPLPVQLSALPEEARVQLGFWKIGNPFAQELEHISGFDSAPEQAQTAVAPATQTLKSSTPVNVSHDADPTGNEATITTSASARQAELMKTHGFDVAHLDSDSFELLVAQLFSGGLLLYSQVEALGFDSEAIQKLLGMCSLPVDVDSLDLVIKQNVIDWFGNHAKQPGIMQLTQNFKVSENTPFPPAKKHKSKAASKGAKRRRSESKQVATSTATQPPPPVPVTEPLAITAPPPPPPLAGAVRKAGSVVPANDSDDEYMSALSDVENFPLSNTEIRKRKKVDRKKISRSTASDAETKTKSTPQSTGSYPATKSPGHKNSTRASDSGFSSGTDETNTAKEAIMNLDGLDFVAAKEIRTYYEDLLNSRSFEKVKEKIAADVVSGELKHKLDQGELVVVTGGWSKTLKLEDMGPLQEHLK